MYRTMTWQEKINYLYNRTKAIIYFILIILIIYFFKITSSEIILFLLIISSLLLILVLLYNLFFPVNLISKKVQIADGYIDEKKEYGISDDRRLYGIAVTLDGSKRTKQKYIPHWFIRGKIPVKIIIYNNKACDFIITKESYNFVDENRSEREKRGDKISSIIGIILAVIIIIIVILAL